MNDFSVRRVAAAILTLTFALIGAVAYAEQAPGNAPPDTASTAVEQKKADDAAGKKVRQDEARKERREHRKALNHRQRRKH